ncbi:MAG: hypothetical protein HRU69_08365 [Flammeovirgaceae bacterium]|nr:MAG: hypothetical protein HRU69_08365 [Flammeovirgaceae bacterium]
MTRFIYIALLSLTGFLLTPPDTYACGSKSENLENTCTKKSDTQKGKKSCCDTDNVQCNNHGRDCDGKCGNPNCHCPANHTYFTIPYFVKFSGFKLIPHKPNFYYQDSFYSSGFLSIWLPPKIG